MIQIESRNSSYFPCVFEECCTGDKLLGIMGLLEERLLIINMLRILFLLGLQPLFTDKLSMCL